MKRIESYKDEEMVHHLCIAHCVNIYFKICFFYFLNYQQIVQSKYMSSSINRVKTFRSVNQKKKKKKNKKKSNNNTNNNNKKLINKGRKNYVKAHGL